MKKVRITSAQTKYHLNQIPISQMEILQDIGFVKIDNDTAAALDSNNLVLYDDNSGIYTVLEDGAEYSDELIDVSGDKEKYDAFMTLHPEINEQTYDSLDFI